MKKIIMTTVAAMAISSTALADAENTFYIKGALGGQFLSENKLGDDKYKSKFAPYLAFGPGYYILDNVRADLTFEYYINPGYKIKKLPAGMSSDKIEANVAALMLSGYVDLFDVSIAKVHAGLGIGLSQVSAKNKYAAVGGVSDSNKFKNKTNFAWAATVGLNSELADGVKGEISYSYKDFGKPKKPTGATTNMKSVGGHHVTFGVRFDI